LIDNTGLTVREALPLLVDMLEERGLRERVKVVASGKLITSADAAWALAAGADMINNARGFMFALGCIQALKCHTNHCPTGVRTHDKKLQRGLDPTNKAVRVANYVKTQMKEIEIIAHACGVCGPGQLSREHIRVMEADGSSRPFWLEGEREEAEKRREDAEDAMEV
jgi:glutamate synthase domain-containing protein 2